VAANCGQSKALDCQLAVEMLEMLKEGPLIAAFLFVLPEFAISVMDE
jgi:hypothetical protein